MIPKNPTPPPQRKTPTPTPAQDSDGEEQIFQRIGDGQGPRLPQQQWSQFLQLDRDTSVQVDRYAKAPKGGGQPSKSHERLMQYGKARTIDQLKRLHPGPPPLWAEDMKNDLHRGHITIDQKALNPPSISLLLSSQPLLLRDGRTPLTISKEWKHSKTCSQRSRQNSQIKISS